MSTHLRKLNVSDLHATIKNSIFIKFNNNADIDQKLFTYQDAAPGHSS